MGSARALLTGLVFVICACGSVSQPAAAVSPTEPLKKPQASPVATPSPPPPWVAPFEAIDFIDRSKGWSVTLSDADHAVEVQRTGDGGATWGAPVKVTSLNVPDGSGIPHFGVRFVNALVGWVFGLGIYSTADGGATWTSSAVPNMTFDVSAVGSSAWAATGCDDRQGTPCPSSILEWNGATQRWTPLAHQPALGSGPLQLIRVNASVAYVVQQPEIDTRLLRTTDGGQAWTRLNIPCKGFGMPTATLDGVHLWMICPSQPGAGNQAKWTYTSDDSGAHWTLRAYDDGIKSSGSMPVNGYAKLLVNTSTTTAFLANDRGDLYRSTDGGKTWIASGLANASEAFFQGLRFVDATTGWFAGVVEGVTPDGHVGLYRTTDGGTSWTLVSSMPSS